MKMIDTSWLLELLTLRAAGVQRHSQPVTTALLKKGGAGGGPGRWTAGPGVAVVRTRGSSEHGCGPLLSTSLP